MSVFIATCGPTGIGKTHQMQRLLNNDRQRFTTVLSVTTRQRRNEKDDDWYRFVTRESLGDLDLSDIITDMTFRGERYLTLRSEIEQAFSRAPVAFMAIVPSIILKLRELGIRHSLINCRVGDAAGYEKRLRRRGYEGDALQKELEAGLGFVYPPQDPAWPQIDLALGSDETDEGQFTAAVEQFAPSP